MRLKSYCSPTEKNPHRLNSTPLHSTNHFLRYFSFFYFLQVFRIVQRLHTGAAFYRTDGLYQEILREIRIIFMPVIFLL